VVAVLIPVLVLIMTAAVITTITMVGRRRGYSGLGGDAVVRCSAGHLFTTIWIPGVSLKAVRLGRVRYQHCPVGHHWAKVTLLRDDELTDDPRREAALHHDARLP
jgi:hypothetical protein